MKIRLLTLSIIAGALCSCIPQNELDTANKIASQIGASACHVSHGASATTESGTHKSIELTFDGISADADVGERLTSYCAYSFFKGSPPLNFKYDQINIEIGDKSSKFEHLYTVSDIKMADTLYNNQSTQFFNSYKADSLRPLADTRFPDSTLHMVSAYMNSVDSAYGAPTDRAFRGFSVEKSEALGENLMSVYTKVSHGDKSQVYRLTYGTQNKKLVYFKSL